ncbi:hypothetical protein VPH35_043972 [Triticum aestivum]
MLCQNLPRGGKGRGDPAAALELGGGGGGGGGAKSRRRCVGSSGNDGTSSESSVSGWGRGRDVSSRASQKRKENRGDKAASERAKKEKAASERPKEKAGSERQRAGWFLLASQRVSWLTWHSIHRLFLNKVHSGSLRGCFYSLFFKVRAYVDG